MLPTPALLFLCGSAFGWPFAYKTQFSVFGRFLVCVTSSHTRPRFAATKGRSAAVPASFLFGGCRGNLLFPQTWQYVEPETSSVPHLMQVDIEIPQCLRISSSGACWFEYCSAIINAAAITPIPIARSNMTIQANMLASPP